GYRFALAVYSYPGPRPVVFAPTPGAAGQSGIWLLVGRSAVSPDTYLSPPDASVRPADAILGDSIRLTGVVFDPPLESLTPGGTLHARLNWEVVRPVSESYTVFVHLNGADGTVVAQQDAVPFDGQFPTWAWAEEQTLSTDYTLTVPDTA